MSISDTNEFDEDYERDDELFSGISADHTPGGVAGLDLISAAASVSTWYL